MGHYKANLRDIEFNLFEALALGELLNSGALGRTRQRDQSRDLGRGGQVRSRSGRRVIRGTS